MVRLASFRTPILIKSKRREDVRLLSDQSKRHSKSSGIVWKKMDDYQRKAVQFAQQVKTAALFLEQGLGKTLLTLGLIEKLVDDKFKALLVVPLTNVVSTWETSILSDLPQVVLCRDWASFKASPCPKILLLHYEALPKIVQKVRRIDFTLIAYDESQRLKSRSTLAARTAHKLRNSSTYKLILSGTPIDSSPSDVWSQFVFLNDEVLGDSWKFFEDEYFEKIDLDYSKLHNKRRGTIAWKKELMKIQIKKRNRGFDMSKLNQFINSIKPYSMRLTKDILDLPPPKIIYKNCVMRGKQKSLYSILLKNFVSELPTITTPLKVSQLAKLCQITGGFVFDDEGDIHLVGYAKLNKLLDILEVKDPPIVIFAKYRAEVEAIEELCKEMGVTRVLTGKTPKADRPNIIRQFQSNKIDYLVCQQRTGGVGVDLFASHIVIFYSVGFSFIDFEQAMARVHRRGQTKRVLAFLLVAQDTVDVEVYDAIVNKRKISDSVLTRMVRKKLL